MNSRHRRLLKLPLLAIALALLALPALRPASLAAPGAQTPGAQLRPEEIEFFEQKIRPVLEASCYTCHSTQTKSSLGGLLLDSREGLLKGGLSGPIITPGEPDKSLLLKAIRFEDPKMQMPPMGKLSDQQIKDFETWVKQGAPIPPSGSAAPAN